MFNLAASVGPVLYVSGEESASQTRLRGERLGVSHKGLLVLAENSLEAILAHAASLKPGVMVVDSIQTVWTSALESAPGSVSQVRESAGKLMLLAKGSNIPVFIVGHVTQGRPRLPGHGFWNIWSIPYYISRETAAIPSASCVQSRIASAPPTRLAYSK